MPTPPLPGFTRRDFLATGAKLGAALIAAPYLARSAPAGGGADSLNLALIGCGEQGRVLLNAAFKIPDIRFRAVCDIWPYNRRYGERLLKKYGHEPVPFEDYREMLSATPDLDAVIVATPDFMHAEHTIAALKAGKHVYCEKLMSNTVDGARSMVRAAREAGRLLQIGHQRRSNPRYIFARDKIVRGDKLLGRVTNATAQWDRAVTEDLGFPAGQGVAEAVLNRYGYANMHEFRNWRWFRRYSGGVISDLGAHQIDVFNWMLGSNPVSVIAGGGRDYYTNHEWYDNVFAIYEYPTEDQVVRTSYQVLTTTSAGGGYYEYFMGDQGALKMSENPKYTKLYREPRAPEWDPWVDKGLVMRPGSGEGAPLPVRPWEKPRPRIPGLSKPASVVDVRETAELSAWDMPVVLDKAIHQPHLENFFDAIRGKAALHSPGEVALATAATVLRVNEAVAARKMLTFAPEDFTV
jgi:predicted dehydrogenase